MKKFSLVLILAFTTFFSSCEKDLEETTSQTYPVNTNFSSRTIPLSDLPQIESYIKNLIQDVEARGDSDDVLENAIFDEKSVIETIDKEGNKNYSISFVYEDTKENIFYNLVVNELPKGEKSSYIFKHISNLTDFERFKESNYNFNYFKGYSEMSLYNGNVTIGNRSGDDDCPEVYIPSANDHNPNGSGGGGGAPENNSAFNQTVVGYNYFPSFGSISVQVGGVTYYQNGGTSGGGAAGGDPCNCYSPPGFGSLFTFIFLKNLARPAYREANGDCIETPPTGYVPVNVAINKLQHIRNVLGLETLKWRWLMTHPDVENEVYEYLINNPNEYSQEVKDFVNEAISNLINGGEVDFKNEIIIDPTFENNQKAKCVLQKLLNLNTDSHFKSIIVNMFASSDKSNIKFSIKNLPDEYDAVTIGSSPYIFPGNSMYNVVLDIDFVNNASTIEIAMTLIHELIHAELTERCIKLGIITQIGYNANYDGIVMFNDGLQLNLNVPTIVINELIKHYKEFNGASEWNHNLMTSLNYVNIIKDNLILAYPYLNNPNSDFITNINNDSQNTFGNFTKEEALQYLSWTGLNSTDLFINNIANNPIENNKFNYISNVSRTKFSNTCN